MEEKSKNKNTGKEKKDYAELLKTLFNEGLRPRPRSDEELIERINEYIDYCGTNGYSPSFPSLAAYCGIGLKEANEIAAGSAEGFGPLSARILQAAGEAAAAVDLVRLGDGSHKSAPGVIFERKQAIPGGGWQDAPKIAVIPADLLRPKDAASLEALTARYRGGSKGRRTLPASPAEIEHDPAPGDGWID